MNRNNNFVRCVDFRYVEHEDGFGWDLFVKMDLATPLITSLSEGIDDKTVVKLGVDLCKALEMCEKNNIVYRVISPRSIFVSKYGDYLLDDSWIKLQVLYTSYGRYMAPEVYSNKPSDGRADLYSLGLVLYWLLNNRRLPFLPQPPEFPTFYDKEKAMIRRYSGEIIPEPVNGSEELKNIVLRACSFNIEDRFANVSEMKTALENLTKSIEKVNKKSSDNNEFVQCEKGHLYYSSGYSSCPICKIIEESKGESLIKKGLKQRLFSKLCEKTCNSCDKIEESLNCDVFSDDNRENQYERYIKKVCPFCGKDYLWGKDDSESYRKRRPILDYCDECNTKLVDVLDSRIDYFVADYCCSSDNIVSFCLPLVYSYGGIQGRLKGLQYAYNNGTLYYKLHNNTLMIYNLSHTDESEYQQFDLKKVKKLKFDVVAIHNEVFYEEYDCDGYERVYKTRYVLVGQILFNKCKCRNGEALKTILTTEIDKKYIVN